MIHSKNKNHTCTLGAPLTGLATLIGCTGSMPTLSRIPSASHALAGCGCSLAPAWTPSRR